MFMDYAVAFSTLLLLEVILGVDNLIFISILVEKLPKHLQSRIRNLGIGLAVFARIGLVFSISWLMTLTKPLVTVFEQSMSGKDLILLGGGLFLLLKSFHELVNWLKEKGQVHSGMVSASVTMILLQIVAIDLVFSFDSVITAVALVHKIEIIVAAIVTSALIMIVMAEKVQVTITAYPGLKLLALLFLTMLGGMLVFEGAGHKLPKSYLYVVLAFGLALESLHIVLDRQQQKSKLKSIQFSVETKFNQRGNPHRNYSGV